MNSTEQQKFKHVCERSLKNLQVRYPERPIHLLKKWARRRAKAAIAKIQRRKNR